ncbi:class I SAM-dependent methyltransferase family protein [Methanoplanus endosymbiosus]|uniref:Class I SAM-dependent methyltransferase family protein n=2 Tax=Methanoplanus endosymbiosus TaxID=33865 RepID=A0A9E7TLH8_9EURY|nr:class I SAM-dependent methyltransferase family protein [Methanoplanus endosymbiosus]
MPVKCWGIKVNKTTGEETRQRLIAEGTLHPDFKPKKDDKYLYFPVKEKIPDSEIFEFEERSRKEELPRHELIGGIAVIHENNINDAELLLKSRPVIHTVLYSESAVTGEYRTKDYQVLAGENTTETDYTEYGLRFKIDLSKAYFSARLANERQRILNSMEEGEKVFDLFAGVGPFAVALSRKASVVIANDINPDAVRLMDENIRLNRIKNITPMLGDALHMPGIFPDGSFDRIIMNLPMNSVPFLKAAFKLCRKGGVIHFYSIQGEEGEMLETLRGFTTGNITENKVRSYAPNLHHAVYDIVFE